MKDAFSLHHLLCSLTLVASFCYGVPASAVDWTITDLGTYSVARGINARGQVVGTRYLSGDNTSPAFLYDGTTMRSLGTLGGTWANAYGINARGQVVGTSFLSGDTTSHAFLYEGTTMRDLNTLGGTESYAYGINASGQVVGLSSTSGDTAAHAFLYEGTTMRDLDTLVGAESVVYDINDSGQMVGERFTSDYTASSAFLYDGTTMRDLGTLGGTWSWANGMNASGQVVGLSYLSGDIASHAFLYDGTTRRDLNTLGGTESQAFGINARGQVVGYSATSGDIAEHAFLYDGAMRDLSTLPEVVAAGWQSLDMARAINDSGQIVGDGTIGGQTHAFRLHPQTTSRYMKTIKPSRLSNLGCAQTNQSGLLILDFGQPWVRSGVYGTIAPGTTTVFFTLAQIETAMKSFMDGYYGCSGKGFMTVAVGTNNFGSLNTTDPTTKSLRYTAHGQAWGQMVARLNNYISSPTTDLRDRLAVVGASDIELGWNKRAISRAWVDGYVSASQGVIYYNYGDAAGCPPALGGCINGWTPEDIWYVSWGDPAKPLKPLPVPQIYYNAPPDPPTNARQWTTLATLYSANPMFIPGVLTTWQACQEKKTCVPGYNTPIQAWQQMMDALYAVSPDPNMVQNVLYSSDITWGN